MIQVGPMNSKTDRQPYRYTALPSTSSFRLLELLPGQDDEIIKFRVIFADWSCPPAYEAISYVWGDAADTVECQCDGKAFAITRNLYRGLVAFRRSNGSRTLWTDAIWCSTPKQTELMEMRLTWRCSINQTDRFELGHQVDNMNKIYARASRILIWLGIDPDGRGKIAVDTINQLGIQLCHALGLAQSDLGLIGCFTSFSEDLQRNIIDTGSLVDAQWQALRWFFTLPWFSRLWVIQELNLSPNALSF